MPTRRQIYTYSASTQLTQLIQGIIAAELLFPSKRIWLFSPWISNIPLLNNNGNTFRHVEPLWHRGLIRLTSVFEKMLESGSEIFIATNKETHNDQIFLWINEMQAKGYTKVNGIRREKLHKKGFLADHFYVSGSMNFTYNGLTTLDEHIEFTKDIQEVSTAQLEFSLYWNESNPLKK